jgi:hypothetical protein
MDGVDSFFINSFNFIYANSSNAEPIMILYDSKIALLHRASNAIYLLTQQNDVVFIQHSWVTFCLKEM